MPNRHEKRCTPKIDDVTKTQNMIGSRTFHPSLFASLLNYINQYITTYNSKVITLLMLLQQSFGFAQLTVDIYISGSCGPIPMNQSTFTIALGHKWLILNKKTTPRHLPLLRPSRCNKGALKHKNDCSASAHSATTLESWLNYALTPTWINYNVCNTFEHFQTLLQTLEHTRLQQVGECIFISSNVEGLVPNFCYTCILYISTCNCTTFLYSNSL